MACIRLSDFTYIELKDRSCRREMVILSCVIYNGLYIF